MSAIAIEIHGIRLADGGSFENFQIERVIADPVPVAPGRVWYNETERAMKFSSLDATGAVVVEVYSTAADLAAAMAQAASDRDAADAALGQRIDNVLSNLDPDAVDSFTEVINAFRDADSSVVGALTQSISDNTNAITQEVADREAGYTELGARIDSLETSVGGSTGDNAQLTTDAKLTLVAAVNEVDSNTDANAASIVALNGTVAANKGDIEAALAQEIADREAGDQAGADDLNSYQTANDAALAAEAARAESAEGNLTGSAFSATENDLTKAVNKVSTDLATEVATLNTAVNAEQSRASGVENGLDTRIAAVEGDETVVGSVANQVDVADQRAQAAESALGQRIDNVLVNLDPEAIDSIAEVINAYQAADSSVMQQATDNSTNITALQSQMATVQGAGAGSIVAAVAAEQSRAQAAEGAMTGAGFSATENDLTKAVNKLSTDLTAEIANRSTDVDAEEARAIGEEQRIEGKVDAEAVRAGGEETRIEGKVDQEVADRQAGDQAIRSDINAGKKSGASATPAIQHLIPHGLDTDNYVLNIMMQDDAGVFRNDVAPVEEVDTNTLKVTLSKAKNIKWSVMSMDAI